MHNRLRHIQFETHRGQPHVSYGHFPDSRQSFPDLCQKHKFCLNSIADELGVSTGILRDSFTDYAGISPKKWMIQYRVILAVQALKEGQEMAEVIDQLGYHDQPHLGKDFKAQLGETPRDLRARIQRYQKIA